MTTSPRPPIGTRALVPVLGAFVASALAYAPPYCFPLLSNAFAHEFSINRTLAVTPWTVFLLATALLSPILGRAFDVFFDRTLLTLGMVLLAVGWIVVSFAADISLLVVAYGGFISLGIGLVFVGTTTAIARRYPGITGLALGIAYAGPGIGLAVALPIVAPLIPAFGWREISLAFAALSLAGLPFVWLMTSGPPVLVPAVAVAGRLAESDVDTRPSTADEAAPELAAAAGIARHPGRPLHPGGGAGLHETSAPGAVGASREPAEPLPPGRSDALRRILRTRRFWILLLGAVGIGAIDEGVYQTFQPHAILRGIDADFAAQALALQALTYVAGQVAGGGLSDRFGRRYVGLLVGVVIAFGATAAFAADGSTPWLALVGNAAYGFAIGATIAIRSAVFSDVFGGRNFGAIVGIMAMAYPLGGIVVMYAGALLYDRLGNYWPVYAIAMFALVWWSAALFIAGPRKHGLRARLRSVRGRATG